jgi:hypothetical protein
MPIRASIVIAIDAMLIVALILLFALDTAVHGMLYDYGLVFSHAWAEPYWLIMRTSMTLIVLAIVILSVLEFVYPLLGKNPSQSKRKQPIERESLKQSKSCLVFPLVCAFRKRD